MLSPWPAQTMDQLSSGSCRNVRQSGPLPSQDRFVILNAAVAATVAIALRLRQRLLHGGYRSTDDRQQIGPLISTIADDIDAGARVNSSPLCRRGLGAIRVVKAFAQDAFERERLEAKSLESVDAAFYARPVRSLIGPIVTGLVAVGAAAVLGFGARLVLADAMTAGTLVVS